MVSSKNSLSVKEFDPDDTPSIGSTMNLNFNFVVDWRAQGKITAIKNQGFSCDSCYAFVTTADI
jgi:C1A family cysteine protease